MSEQKQKAGNRSVEEGVSQNLSLTQIDTAAPISPGESLVSNRKEAVLKSTEPSQVQVQVQEKMRSITPRKTVTRFRCAGKWWSAIQGQEMKVPVGVAEHMENVGML